jgi:hypothetical protein
MEINDEINDGNLRRFIQLYVNDKKDKLPVFLRKKKIGDWDVSKVTNMSYMFSNCNKFNQPLNGWGAHISNVTTMDYMFHNCEKFDQPLDSWGENVSNVTEMNGMFWGCKEFNQKLNSWRVSNNTNMNTMFWDCPMKNSIYKPITETEDDAAERKLGQFYEANQAKQETSAKKCNDETDCIITSISLEKLRGMKRLVVLYDNEKKLQQCYAFYAFIGDEKELKELGGNNPLQYSLLTQKEWSEDSLNDIAIIRKYKNFLNKEYLKLPDSPRGGTTIPPKKKIRSRVRQRCKTKSLSLPSVSSRRSRKIRSNISM